MKKILRPFKTLSILTLVLLVTIACDKDFTNIESDIQGAKNFATDSKKFPIVSYTKTFTPETMAGQTDLVGVQTNNLTSNFLGVYKDPNSEFGTTTASIVTQILPASYNPDFGTDPVLESVVLNIPFFSTILNTDDEGNNTYKLDSIFGNQGAPFKLSIYKNNYILRDLDPATDFEETQAYYSNQEELFCGLIQSEDLIYEIDAFTPSAEEHREYGNEEAPEEVTARYAPSLRVNLYDPENLTDTFWQDLLSFSNEDENPPELSNANNFTEFFRGLIFKVEQIGDDGNMIALNFSSSNANILVDYTNNEEAESDDEDTKNQTIFYFTFSGNMANTFNNTLNLPVIGNEAEGDDNLYLKGGDGTMAVIDLFNGMTEDEDGNDIEALTYFKDKKNKWLINEANLIFYVNQNLVNGDEPDRVVLYDLKNNTPITDFYLDGSISTTDPLNSITGHSEVLERDNDENGIRYKFRLTEHINNILQRDSTNVKLGLFSVSNINLIQQSKVQGMPEDNDESTLNIVPTTSVLAPKGTILYGSKTTLPEGQRAEFEIFYTEPEN